MNIENLNDNDRLVLVALMEKIILADRKASREEMEHLVRLIDALGQDTYSLLMMQVEDNWGDRPQTEAFLGSVTNQDARELIYETIFSVAVEDGLDPGEIELLDWLR